jgi:hypothetical protein
MQESDILGYKPWMKQANQDVRKRKQTGHTDPDPC